MTEQEIKQEKELDFEYVTYIDNDIKSLKQKLEANQVKIHYISRKIDDRDKVAINWINKKFNCQKTSYQKNELS